MSAIRQPTIIVEPGTSGTYSGFPATVIRHYDGDMYEIRMPGGWACAHIGNFVADDAGMNRAQFHIGPTPEEAERADYLPYVLTPSERTQAAIAATRLEQNRIEQNRRDDSRALAGVLWTGEGA